MFISSQDALSTDFRRADRKKYGLQPRSEILAPDLHMCWNESTPACIRALYNIPGPKEIADGYNSDPSNSAGVFTLDAGYYQKDLNMFYNSSAPQVPKGTQPTFDPIAGADPGYMSINTAEASLDLEVMFSLIYPKNIAHDSLLPLLLA